MNVHAPQPDKYRRYRARKRAAGLKQVRIWTLDAEAPGFGEALAADQDRIRNSDDERATIALVEAMMAEDLAREDANDSF